MAKPTRQSRIHSRPKRAGELQTPPPASGLLLRAQTRVELKKLHLRLGTSAIEVTHDQVEAMTLGDRVEVMRDSVVQQVGESLRPR